MGVFKHRKALSSQIGLCSDPHIRVINLTSLRNMTFANISRPWASAAKGGKTGICPPPLEIGTKKQKVSGKREISSLILISWVNSCNDSLFADMTLTLHKSQVHCVGNMQL